MDLTPYSGRTQDFERFLEVLEEEGREPALAKALRTALDRVQAQIIERQEREITQLGEVLASTQAWAREMEAGAIARDRDLDRLNRALPVRVARRVRRVWSRL